MVNPVYLFFASRAGAAGTLLRWTMAGLVLMAAVTRGGGGAASGYVLPWLNGHLVPDGIFGTMLLAATGFLLLAGFFTRACAVLLLAMLAGSFSALNFAEPGAGQPTEWILSASICLTLAIAGAGSMSIDRRISNFFLPTLN
jgi:uncharacterized membrane protein YphA (DoxX/SURF4 family)